jgi:hypothetical protein
MRLTSQTPSPSRRSPPIAIGRLHLVGGRHRPRPLRAAGVGGVEEVDELAQQLAGR